MTQYETHLLSVCTVCYHAFLENEVDEDFSYDFEDDEWQCSSEALERLYAIFGDMISVAEDDPEEFATTQCECCGSTLAGNRFYLTATEFL